MPTAVAPKSKPTILERAQMRAQELRRTRYARPTAPCGPLGWNLLRSGWPEKQLSPHENSPLKIGSTWFETQILHLLG